MTRVAERMETVRVSAGETVVRQGEDADALFIVVHGRVAVSQRGPDGTERELNRLGPGELFGEIGLLTGQPRIATVRAIEPSELLRLDKATFGSLVSASSATREQLDEIAKKRLAAGVGR